MTEETETPRCAQCEIYRAEITSLKKQLALGWMWFLVGPGLLACWLFVLLSLRPFDSAIGGWTSYLVLGLQMGSCFGAFYFAAAVALLFNSAGWKKAVAFSVFTVVLSGYLHWLIDEDDEVAKLTIHGWILLPVMLMPALWCMWRNQSTFSIGTIGENQNAISISTFIWLTGWSAVYLVILRDSLKKMDLDDIKIYCSIFIPLSLVIGNWAVSFLVRERSIRSRSAIWLVLTTLVLIVASTSYLFLFVSGTSPSEVVMLWGFGVMLVISSTSIVVAGRWWLGEGCR